MDRRAFIISSAIGAVASANISKQTHRKADSNPATENFRFCLNTSTIRGQNLSIVEEIRIAKEAGYSGIEPWIGNIRKYLEAGNSVQQLRKVFDDSGLAIESAIGFANWIVDDNEKRKQGLENARRDMELIRDLGGTRIAAPPAGTRDSVDLYKAAERYRKLLEIGDEVGVVPQLELWGHSEPINRLGELAFIATEAAHPSACLLPDVYHIFKGGSDFDGLKMLNGKQMFCFHMNDYPASPARDKISDADRVYPGDGVAPLDFILRTLVEIGFNGALSLELFNRQLWEQDPLEVAKTGLQKMQSAVQRAMG